MDFLVGLGLAMPPWPVEMAVNSCAANISVQPRGSKRGQDELIVGIHPSFRIEISFCDSRQFSLLVLSTSVIVLLICQTRTLPIVISQQSYQKTQKLDDENYATS